MSTPESNQNFKLTSLWISSIFVSLHHGRGHIVFSGDPVGGSGVATCLHSISLLNGQILAKLYTNISLGVGGGGMLIRF